MSVFGQYENAHYITEPGQGFQFLDNGNIDLFDLPKDINVQESVSTYSDKNGNFLFFANHSNLYNRDMEITPNGNLLRGKHTANQGQFFIPFLGNSDSIYLIQTDLGGVEFYRRGATIIYSVIDMSMDEGKGDIVTELKNIELFKGVCEGITVIPGECNTIWIVARLFSDELVAIPLRDEGFGNPVISKVIGLDKIVEDLLYGTERGFFTFRQDIDRLLLSIPSHGIIESYNFDPITGVFDNGILIENYNLERHDLPNNDFGPFWNAIFDSTGSNVIATENAWGDSLLRIVKYDIMAEDIRKSKIVLMTIKGISEYSQLLPFVHPYSEEIFFMNVEMQKATQVNSSKIFKFDCDSNWLCNLEFYKNIPRKVRWPIFLNQGLRPQNSLPATFLPEDTILCDPTNFELSISATDYDSVVWSDGYRGDRRLVEQPGVYSATIYKGGCDRTDDIEIRRTDDSPLMPSSRVDLCESGSVSAIDGGVYHWSDGSVGSSIQVDRSGSYWVENRTADCVQRDSFEVVIEAFEVVLSDSYMLCEGESVTLEPDIGNATSPKYTWSTGATMPSIEVDSAGVYSVEVESGQGCRSHTSTMVEQEERVRIELLRDTTICTGSILEVSYNDELVRWSTGEVSRKLFMDRSDIISGIGVESCIEIAPFEIGIQDCEPETPVDCVVSIPNALMRSSEDINRSFLVFSTCDGMDVKYEVFDRWGNVMFRGIGEQRWLPESDVNTGVYVLKLSYRRDSTLPYKIKYGTIHVF